MSSRKTRIALVGATGIVGTTALKVLAERGFEQYELFPFATFSGAERRVIFGDKVLEVIQLPEVIPDIDYALFCAPGEVARALVPVWSNAGIKIVDNSSVFRLTKGVPLVVPEINNILIPKANNIIANPNCSTIQLAVALAPLHFQWELKRVHVSTYQSVSGAGIDGVMQWKAEQKNAPYNNKPFPRRIHGNVIPMIGDMHSDGYTTEELKLMREFPRILNEPGLDITATAVRVPVAVSHGEAVEVKLGCEVELNDVMHCLDNAEGIVLCPHASDFPTPVEVEDSDSVFVGRVRLHPDDKSRVLMWVVADNLRKGAATNAVQIMEQWMEISG